MNLRKRIEYLKLWQSFLFHTVIAYIGMAKANRKADKFKHSLKKARHPKADEIAKALDEIKELHHRRFVTLRHEQRILLKGRITNP
jgi:hypothetical protein